MSQQQQKMLKFLFELIEKGDLDKVADVCDITPEDADYTEYRLHYKEHAGEIRRRDDSSFVYFDLGASDPEIYKPSPLSLWLLLVSIE